MTGVPSALSILSVRPGGLPVRPSYLSPDWIFGPSCILPAVVPFFSPALLIYSVAIVCTSLRPNAG